MSLEVSSTQEIVIMVGLVGVAGAIAYYEWSKASGNSGGATHGGDTSQDTPGCPGYAGGTPGTGGNGSWLDQALEELAHKWGFVSCPPPGTEYTLFTGAFHHVKGPSGCDPNSDSDCDDYTDDCGQPVTVKDWLTPDQVKPYQSHSPTWVISSPADLAAIVADCKARQAAQKQKVDDNKAEADRFTALEARLTTQFSADCAAGNRPSEFTTTFLSGQADIAQLGPYYKQKIIDEFTSALSAWDAKFSQFGGGGVCAGYDPYHGNPLKDYNAEAAQILSNWKSAIDAAKPKGPWPKPPSYLDLKCGSNFPDALAQSTANTLAGYLANAQQGH